VHYFVVTYPPDESKFACVNEFMFSIITVEASDNRLTFKYVVQIRLADNNFNAYLFVVTTYKIQQGYFLNNKFHILHFGVTPCDGVTRCGSHPTHFSSDATEENYIKTAVRKKGCLNRLRENKEVFSSLRSS